MTVSEDIFGAFGTSFGGSGTLLRSRSFQSDFGGGGGS
jgi:hypothetical protein